MAPRAPRRALAAVVLAAGKGKRMKSARAKVLHEVCGRPSLWYVIRAALGARPTSLIVVVGHDKEQVVAAVDSWRLSAKPVFVDQGEPLGTAHALSKAEPAIGNAEDVLTLSGDDPLVTPENVRELLRVHRRTKAAASLLTTEVDDPRGYHRVVRHGDDLIEIVEEADAPPEVLRSREVATLVYVLRREDLFKALPLVGRDNRLREYYLPDVLTILKEKGERVSAVQVDMGGALGLNSRGGLAEVTRVMRGRIVRAHMDAGVTFVDPDTAYVDIDVRIDPDTVVLPITFLEGRTRIGARSRIGPSTRIVDSVVGEGCEVTFAVVREARIGSGASVGPYASIRPETVLEEGAKAGTFVEIKASRVRKGSKVPHLSYVGDATIGRDTNIGAGTVTVNYDGFEKHRTTIGEEVHIGSDTMLVAPVRVGRRAWIGAGSVITRNVPPGALAVERSEQKIVRGYDERKRAAQAAKARAKKAGKAGSDTGTKGGRREAGGKGGRGRG